jgi:hypothetical protein
VTSAPEFPPEERPLRESINDVVNDRDKMGTAEFSKRLVQIRARGGKELGRAMRSAASSIESFRLGVAKSTEPPTPSQLAGKKPRVLHVPIWRRKWLQIRLVGSVER